MNIIFFARHRGETRQFNLRHPPVAAAGLAALLGVLAAAFAAGYQLASGAGEVDPDARITAWQRLLVHQGEQISELEQASRERIDALAVRLGLMNAHIIRLDALGRRLTRMANLEDGEFDFEGAPAQGGPEPDLPGESLALADLQASLDRLALQIEDRGQQLGVLESMLLNRHLRQQVHPEGRPVKAGWISSYFGRRTDPFTGRTAQHNGIDFAGRAGAEVVAVAAGVVTWSRERYGYGRMVEINHGNGYVTRYAHNETNLVAVGDAVKRGQTVALMGSTGRATGPNLHFEVLYGGKVVNPLEYIKGSGD